MPSATSIRLPSLEKEVQSARGELASRLGSSASDSRCVVSPYRICPLGAHSDHQGGTVLGMAITAYTVLAFVPSSDSTVEVHRCDGRESSGDGSSGADLVRFDLREPGEPERGHWGSYPRGAATILQPRIEGEGRGFVGVVRGSLPGAGLSSSASVDLAYLLALATVNGVSLDPLDLARGAMRVETEYLGLDCGLLDPASIVGARRDHLLRIDCRDERWEALPASPRTPPYRVLVAFSGLGRQLAATGFNDRVAECRQAAAAIGEQLGRAGVERLGDLPLEAVEEHLETLPGPLCRRARHFATEARRVEEGLDAWKGGDLERFGRLVDASCKSSVENYECGTRELVELHEILRRCPGVLGNRFSGGGYGGCCIALVDAEAAEAICREAERRYLERHPELREKAAFFVVRSEDGVRLL